MPTDAIVRAGCDPWAAAPGVQNQKFVEQASPDLSGRNPADAGPRRKPWVGEPSLTPVPSVAAATGRGVSRSAGRSEGPPPAAAHACCALFWQSAPSLGRNQVAAFPLPSRRHVQFHGRAYRAQYAEVAAHVAAEVDLSNLAESTQRG